jgi:hypothetical protein
MTHLLKKGELKTSSLLYRKKGKRQPAREKAPQIKRKDCLLLTLGVVEEGRDDDDDSEDE